MRHSTVAVQKVQGPFGFWYFLGIIGSAVYFVEQVHGFWPVILALLESLVWPAFLIHDLFKFLTQ